MGALKGSSLGLSWRGWGWEWEWYKKA